ncbi:hypothetical protein [Blastopirellula marina]|uniref:hypothetical protein n=1 Tax=Blastopirellula marina TaxID=124 RepID=UPI001929D59F|nr:hypothetical protein [Blastopirellula marina]
MVTQRELVPLGEMNLGFTVYYRSTEPVSDANSVRITDGASAICRERDWLSCEPVRFSNTTDGHLKGGSKPNFSPHPKEVASFNQQELPDGTMHDALEVLCELSREHGVNWEFSHDHDEGPIGFIVAGKCDDNLLAQIEALDELVTMISGVEGSNAESPNIYVEDDLVDDIIDDLDDFAPEVEVETEEEEPPILKFPG